MDAPRRCTRVVMSSLSCRRRCGGRAGELYVEVRHVSCGRSSGRVLLGQRSHESICHRPPTSLLIAPSSDDASSSNWHNVGVDGIKMAAMLFTSMTAACQLHGRLSEPGDGGTGWGGVMRDRTEHGRERERERKSGRKRGTQSFISCLFWDMNLSCFSLKTHNKYKVNWLITDRMII